MIKLVDRRKARRRAISPIIATLILIVIAVVAAVAVFGFIQGFIAQTTTNAQAPSSIVIDAASVSTSSGVTVVVRNVGLTDTTITGVYVLNPTDLSLYGSASASTTLSANSITTVVAASVTWSATPSAGAFVIVKVVTADGSSATYKVKVSS